MSSSWLQAFGETLKVPGLLVEVYKDVAQPGVQQVGKALQTVLGLGNTVLWPIALANERSRMALEENLRKYQRKLASTSPDDIVEVAPEVGVPLAEKLSYVTDVHLSELYVSLLAAASTSQTVELVHPSFVNVLNNMAPDEALLLQGFGGPEFVIPSISPCWRSVTENDTIYFSRTHALISNELTSKLRFKNSVPAYLANLEGLGLLEIDPEGDLSAPVNAYDELNATWKVRFEQEGLHPDRTLRLRQGNISSTSHGEQFWRACHAVGSS